MTKKNVFTNTLNLIEDETEGKEIAFGDILKALNHSGFGPVLMVPALLALLPTGAVPGIPALCGITLCLISPQIIAGRSYPWIPKKLEKMSFNRKKIISLLNRGRPTAKFIDRFVHPRLDFLSNSIVERTVAVLCFLLGALMITAGFVPFVPALIAFPILLFGLGISARDGAMTMAGFAITGIVFFIILSLSGAMGGEDQLHIGEAFSINSAPPQSIDLNMLDNL